jgi:Icc-related predicted phosphoesterase
MRVILVGLGMALCGTTATAAEHASWEAYVQKNRYTCPGPFDTLKRPRTVKVSGKSYEHDGYKMVVQNADSDHQITLGVVSAIKDVKPATRKNLAGALAWFKEGGAEWLVANGDLALEEQDLGEVLDLLGDTGLPVLIVLGNSESKGSFARVYRTRMKKYPNLINGVLIRQIIADDVEFWTMPGYYDRDFRRQGAACGYQEKDVRTLGATLKPAGKGPVTLVSHGPPAGKGPTALDWVTSKKNVGDAALAELIKEKKIPFGLFGHILEAGGNAVGADLSSPVESDHEVAALYINAGSLSGEPWTMNDGKTSFGMALLLTIKGDKATYQIRRFDQPKAD